MGRDPNIIYFAVLLLWPFVAYRIYKKYEINKAVALLFIIPYMFFPVTSGEAPLKLPFLPGLDKTILPPIVAIIILWLNKEKVQYLPRYGLASILIIMFFLAPFLTIFTNTDPLHYGPKTIPGLTIKDAVSTFQSSFFAVYIPFIIGFSFLGSKDSHQMLVRLLFVLGMFYTLLMLYEVRMSPQLHNIVYGYFPHEWRQQVRAGGFRPVVFLGHGLLVAIFAVLLAICTFTLWRQKDPTVKSKGLLAFLYVVVVIVLCKTYSALIYILLFIGIVLLFRKVNQLRIAAAVAVFILLFPLIRGTDYIPLTDVAEFFTGLDEERGGSLLFRLRHEDALMDKANERRWFGWGTWGRNRVFDPRTGEDLSVTDGTWILRFGVMGWFGYIAAFGLICYPIIAIYRYYRKNGEEEEVSAYSVALAMILMIYLIDQIPNASLNHMIYLMSGALLGLAARLRSDNSARRT